MCCQIKIIKLVKPKFNNCYTTYTHLPLPTKFMLLDCIFVTHYKDEYNCCHFKYLNDRVLRLQMTKNQFNTLER